MSLFVRPSGRSTDVAVLRPLAPGETRPLVAVFEGLSLTSRIRRFHTAVPHLTPTMAARLADVRPGEHEAFVATLGGTAVGIGRWVRYAARPHCADVAIEVIDLHHGRGIGRRLLGEIAVTAASAGVKFLVFSVLAENVVVRRALWTAGAVVDPEDADQLWVPTRALLAHLRHGRRTLRVTG